MNKKKENLKKMGRRAVAVAAATVGRGGACRTLQSTNEGYVAWQNSVIATHK